MLLCQLCAVALKPPGAPFCPTCWELLKTFEPAERARLISQAQLTVAITEACGAMKRLSDDVRDIVDLSRVGE